MKNIGYYYSDELKTLIIGFEDSKGRLHGKVLGNTFESDLGNMLAPFSYGYRYNSWHEGFIYVGTACSFPLTRQNSLDVIPLREEELYPALPESASGGAN